MFEFFKYAVDELNGIDHEKKKEEMKQKETEMDSKKILISRKFRNVVVVFGALYLIIAFLSVSLLKNTGHGIESYFQYIILSAMDIGIVILLFMRKKAAEIVALVGIVLFVAVMFVLA